MRFHRVKKRYEYCISPVLMRSASVRGILLILMNGFGVCLGITVQNKASTGT